MATINYLEGTFKILFASKSGGSNFGEKHIRDAFESFLKDRGFKVLADDIIVDTESFDMDTDEAIEIVEGTLNLDPEECGFVKTWQLDEDNL